MNRIRIALTALVLAFVAGALPRPALAADKGLIGYVNLQRAIVEVEDGKRAKARLEKTFKEKQAALQKEEAELEAMKEQLKGADMSKEDPETRAKVLALQKKFLALREALMKEQQELKKLEGEALSKITKKMRKVVEQLGKSGGYMMIIEAQESSILFAKPHLDVTNEVIRRYNAKYGK